MRPGLEKHFCVVKERAESDSYFLWYWAKVKLANLEPGLSGLVSDSDVLGYELEKERMLWWPSQL